MVKSIAEMREKKLEKHLNGVSYPMMYVRQAWYDADDSPVYRELQQLLRAHYPDLVFRLTFPPYPYAAEALADCWAQMDEIGHADIRQYHHSLYRRLEWFVRYMYKRRGLDMGEDTDEYNLIQSNYQRTMKVLQ